MKSKTPRRSSAGKLAPAITYPILTDPGKAKFIVADGTTREVPWIETPSLPAEKVQDVVNKAQRDNDDAIASYGYDVPTLVKLQEAQIAIAAGVVARLGEAPAHADEEIVRYAMTDIRDTLPCR
jgi:hypothetical protein